MKYRYVFLLILIASFRVVAQSEDSVDVTFYYFPDNSPSTVYLRGEFNGWTTANSMTYDPATSSWSATLRLRKGGPSPLPAPVSIAGAYQYKFFADNIWLPDPLNPRQNPNDNDNSYLYINNPTIHLLLPNSTPASGIIRTRFPDITAYIFPSISSDVDTSTITVSIDGTQFTNLGSSYDEETKRLSFVPPIPLGDGQHDLVLSAQSTLGTSNSDSTTFTVQANVMERYSIVQADSIQQSALQ